MPSIQIIHNPSMNKLIRNLLVQMKDAGFATATIKGCLSTISPIQTFMKLVDTSEYSQDVGDKYLEWYQKHYNCNQKNMNRVRRYVGLLNDCYNGIRIVRKNTAEIHNDSLKKKLDGLLIQLKSEGYSDTTLRNYMTRLRPIQDYMRDNYVDKYTPDIGLEYYNDYLMRNNPGSIQKREILAAILRLNDYCSGCNYKIRHIFCEPLSVPDPFTKDVQGFFSSVQFVSVKERTVGRRTRALARFLNKCQRCGASSVDSFTPHIVILACMDVSDIDDWITIRQFLYYLSKEGVTENDLSTFVPKRRRETPVPSTYSIEEIRLIESAVDRNSHQGKRDYVVLLMVDRLAIRAGDIARMKLNNLDFKSETINYVQEKTNNEITITMLPELKEALEIYLEEANTEDGFLFHSFYAPHHPLRSSAIYGIVNKYFRIMEINTFGKKHGPHSIRASVSTSMINDDVPYEVVKDVLGHTSPNAIRHYAKNDIEKLRRCAIPVPAASGKFLEFLKGGAR